MRRFRQELKIEGRVALVTGAANGIGRSVARQIKKKGGIPVCVDLPSDNLDSLAVELGANALVTACDVSDIEGMQRIVSEAVAKFGRIDIVVANAGVEKIGASWVMPEADFEQVLRVNILGVYRTIRPAVQHVIQSQGHIVAVSSVSAVIPWPLAAAYGASKAFVDSWMRSLRMELSGTGATAGAVYFGYIDTGMMQRATSDERASDLLDNIPWIASTPPKSPETAARVIIRQIERRSARGYSHFKVRLLLLFRGISQIADPLVARQMKIGESIMNDYGRPS